MGTLLKGWVAKTRGAAVDIEIDGVNIVQKCKNQ